MQEDAFRFSTKACRGFEGKIGINLPVQLKHHGEWITILITIVAVGKINENYLKEGIAEFTKRIGKYSKLKILEISEEKAPAKLSEKEEGIIKAREGERILGSIPDNSYVIALHGQGREYSSQGLASLLEELRLDGKSSITFIIGGTLGLSETVLNKAHLSISFGKITFPHQMMRLILLEQIFRSFKIISGEPYHR